MKILLITLHVLAAFVMVTVVLLQHGKGADIGATFGAGASQTVFGGRGAGNFLSKLTTWCVVVFMLTSISLTYFTNPSSVPGLFDDAPAMAPSQPQVEELPAETIPGAQPIEGQPAPTESAVEEIAPPTAPATPPAEPAPTPTPDAPTPAPSPDGQ
jgi:preprotein translocase subunit SecG